MLTDETAPDAMHFKSLRLENVRAFGSSQSLEFVDDWNLIVGDNGVGKTTLLQLLAVMRPVPAQAPATLAPIKFDDDARREFVEAEFSAHENKDIIGFLRRGGTRTMKIDTDLVGTETDKLLRIGAEITGDGKDLEEVEFSKAEYGLRSGGPLVVGYGAGRHIGHHNLKEVAARTATQSLFADASDLYDAAELVEGLDYAKRIDPDGKDAKRLRMLKHAIVSLLPDGLIAQDIDVRGPSIEGRDPDLCGVHVRTPSGITPLADLSLGYQAMFALTVDLAWRLFNSFPESEAPLSESAIVLIDEVDLHLNPRWQRHLRKNLLAQFPKVQFIVTTHNPVTVEETLSEGGTVSAVCWVGNEAHILNPVPNGEWRYEQLLDSELFGFSEWSQQTEAKLYKRLELIQKGRNRSVDDEALLKELDQFAASLPEADSPSAQAFEDLVMNLAKNYPSGLSQ